MLGKKNLGRRSKISVLRFARRDPDAARVTDAHLSNLALSTVPHLLSGPKLEVLSKELMAAADESDPYAGYHPAHEKAIEVAKEIIMCGEVPYVLAGLQLLGRLAYPSRALHVQLMGLVVLAQDLSWTTQGRVHAGAEHERTSDKVKLAAKEALRNIYARVGTTPEDGLAWLRQHRLDFL